MRRREFIAGLTLPLFARAALAQQAEAPRRIGWLGTAAPGSGPELRAIRNAFTDELRRRGWVEGRNLEIVNRWSDGVRERLPALADEMVKSKVEVVVATANAHAQAVKDAAPNLPIVVMLMSTPLESGLVASLAHPGGMVTGTTPATEELSGKRFEILKETFPETSTVAVLLSPPASVDDATIRAAAALGMRLIVVRLGAGDDVALAIAAERKADAWFVVDIALIAARRRAVVAAIAATRKPAIYPQRFYVEAGGLMSYAVDLKDLYRRGASHVDRILRGEKPADLPVELPTKFELVINLKTAKRLGLVIPPTLLTRADEVIE